MDNFWEDRYVAGGNSGAGSYGSIATHKAQVINEIIRDFEIKTISDFGCGDGNQLSLLSAFDEYHGYDISPFIVKKCEETFGKENIKFYDKIDEIPHADLCLSLDVIYHIIYEDDFINYMSELFNKSKKYVLIFSSDHADNNHQATNYIFHRKISEYIKNKFINFELIKTINNSLETSAKFFLFKKI